MVPEQLNTLQSKTKIIAIVLESPDDQTGESNLISILASGMGTLSSFLHVMNMFAPDGKLYGHIKHYEQ